MREARIHKRIEGFFGIKLHVRPGKGECMVRSADRRLFLCPLLAISAIAGCTGACSYFAPPTIVPSGAKRAPGPHLLPRWSRL